MKDSTAGTAVRRPRTTIRPQRYLNDSDLGVIVVDPGATVFSSIFSVEGFLDSTLQALDTSGGTAWQFIELGVQVASDIDGFTGGAVVQVIAGAGWMTAAWSSVTWSWARVRPIARRVRLRFRHTNAAALDEFQGTLRLMLRGAPMLTRLRMGA